MPGSATDLQDLDSKYKAGTCGSRKESKTCRDAAEAGERQGGTTGGFAVGGPPGSEGGKSRGLLSWVFPTPEGGNTTVQGSYQVIQ